MNYQIPYASLYNQEPGIPLSLKAPSLTDARFTMEVPRMPLGLRINC